MQFLATEFHKLVADYEMRFNHLVPMEILKYSTEDSIIEIIKSSLSKNQPVEAWEQRSKEQEGTIFDLQYNL